jgi:hypothetical protein
MHKELICLIFSIVLLSLAGFAAKNVKQCKKAEAIDTNNHLGGIIIIPADNFLIGNNGHEGYEGLEEIPLSTLFTFQPII